MFNILFYGDSNTWGFDPETTLRYPYPLRWTTVCAKLLGEEYNCIPAGMNGRTTVFDDPLKGARNGLTGLDYELQSHKPLDLMVVMLGTNDCSAELDLRAEEIAQGMEKLLRTADRILRERQGYAPRIILVCPPPIEESVWEGPFAADTNKKGLRTSAELPALYERLAR